MEDPRQGPPSEVHGGGEGAGDAGGGAVTLMLSTKVSPLPWSSWTWGLHARGRRLRFLIGACRRDGWSSHGWIGCHGMGFRDSDFFEVFFFTSGPDLLKPINQIRSN